ncbi:hypothetical protein [Streptomyces lasiicapitis]|uniref:hypothetical protein n=1 Tax=Streptomyces lasiicapitis TaxID=1923961 RepID=UPI0036926C33
METVVTVIALLALTALGVLLIHRLNTQHNERIASFHYGRPRATMRTPAPPVPPKPDTPAGPTATGDRRDHRVGGRGRFRPRRRP